MMRIVVFGAGKLGFPWGLLLMEKGHDVVFVDTNQDLVDAINDGSFETWEPEVNRLYKHLAPLATTDPAEAMEGADRAYIFVPTYPPVQNRFDPSRVADVFEVVTDHIRHGKVSSLPFAVVIKSTLWPGQTRMIWESARQCSSDLVTLYYNPELVRLGNVVKDMRNPPMQILGIHPDMVQQDPIIADAVARGKKTLHVMNWTEAEAAKAGLNAALSMKSAFSFDMMRCCEVAGIDPMPIMEAIGSDPRIGPDMLSPQFPLPGGPCLPPDTLALSAWADSLGVVAYAFDAPHLARVVELEEILNRLQDAKIVAILGTTYKPGVPITDNSIGQKVLWAQNRHVYVVDYDLPGPQEILPETDAVVLCSRDQRLIDLVPEFTNARIIDPWGAL